MHKDEKKQKRDNDEDEQQQVYKFSADRPPTMASTTGSVMTRSGSYVPQRCSSEQLERLPNVFAVEKVATQQCLAPAVLAFVNRGAEDEESLRCNRQGFSRYCLRPRVLKNVSRVDLSTTILQGRVSLCFPLCIAPFAGCRVVHPDGELTVAMAAAQAGIVYTVPNWGGTSVQDIVAAKNKAEAPLFFQIYPLKPTHAGEGFHRAHTASMLEYLASLGGFVAVILTCDTVNNSNREKTYKNPEWIQDLNDQVGGFPEPCALEHADNLPNIAKPGHSSSITWKDIHWMKAECEKYDLALILKGIMTKEDTALAVRAGVDAIVVSNHGGRQLDGTMGTVEVVEECVRAAQGSSLEVYVDGGIRRGKDLAKCLALGAKCVFVGRPILWGLAAGGYDGVSRVLDIFREEFQTVLQLVGCSSPQELSRAHVHDRLSQSVAPIHEELGAVGTDKDWAVAVVLLSVAAFIGGRCSRR